MTTALEQAGQAIYSTFKDTISVETVRASNVKGRNLCGLVTVFVGGTGAVGESTAKELFKRTVKPKAYIIARGSAKQDRIIEELREINPDGEAIPMQTDITLLRNVDTVCEEIKKAEPKLHCLFLTAGFMKLEGRKETAEGFDRKMTVNYYARSRFIHNLLPLLTTASDAHELSRVITVLGAGCEGELRLDDLDLKHNFTLHACLAHCVVMTDFLIEELTKRHPGISFIHSYPGTVKTGIANQLTGRAKLAAKVLYAVSAPWIINMRDSGERHFFQMTSQCYPAAKAGVGIPIPEGISAIKGIDGQPGSGVYLLDWDGTATGDESVLKTYREMGLGPKIWDHTQAVFRQAERAMRKASKRPAEDEGEENEGRSTRVPRNWQGPPDRTPDPPGWRPAV